MIFFFKYFLKIQLFQEALIYSLELNINNTEIFNKATREAWKKLMSLVAEYLGTGISKQEQKIKALNTLLHK
jgi:hypothetical protein